MRIPKWPLIVATAAATIGSLPANATPVTTVGVAVGSVNSTSEVGTKENIGSLGGDAIKYFIPLGNSGGTYGVGQYKCGGSGFGTCSDSGKGGETLKMILYFSNVSTTAPSLLTINFEDLDLKGANDPSGFVESLNIFQSGKSLTGWIKSLGPIGTDGSVSGNHDTQTLTLSLDQPAATSLWLVLKFKAHSDFYGYNTAEYLRATLTEDSLAPPIDPVPLPGALLLMGSALAGCFGVGRWQRRRAQA